jgi:glycosyltransferase involved in cell wall biosynthesis
MPPCRTSVAVATCEGGRFIDEQLDSIASQSRLPDELVVVDDASLDTTVERVEAFAAKVRFPVRIERNPERIGATANFARCVSLCTGEVILLADQDDVWNPDKIATLVGILEERPGIGLVFSNGEVVDEALRPLGYDLWRSLFFDERDRARVRAGEATAVFARRVVAAGTTLAFRARFCPMLVPFPDLPSVHDAWIAFLIASVSGCEIVETPLIRYRLHGANQIGLRRRGLFEQYRQARQQIAQQAFAREARFFELARERLRCVANEHPVSDAGLRVIDEKIAHSHVRDSMPKGFLTRIPIVAREWWRGHYGRYGYGLKSVAQDLWLR